MPHPKHKTITAKLQRKRQAITLFRGLAPESVIFSGAPPSLKDHLHISEGTAENTHELLHRDLVRHHLDQPQSLHRNLRVMRSTFAELPLPGHQPQRSLQSETPSQICRRSLAFLLRHPFCANGSQRHTSSRFEKGLAAARSHQGADVLFRNSDLAKHLLLARAARGRFHRPAPGVHDLQVVTGQVLQDKPLGMLQGHCPHIFVKKLLQEPSVDHRTRNNLNLAGLHLRLRGRRLEARGASTCEADLPESQSTSSRSRTPLSARARLQHSSKSACALPLPR